MIHDLILSIDQGTSGSKAVIFHKNGDIICDGRASLKSYHPKEGWVEQDPEEIYLSVLSSTSKALEQLQRENIPVTDIKCCGISNQRETFLLWDKNGNPLSKAIIWQCKRSISICQEIIKNKHEDFLRKKTGLFADPYFSGTKLFWLYRNDENIKKQIDSKNAYFGNIDTWLLYKLTNGKEYKTDYTNASRTLLFNLKDLKWDSEILEKYNLTNLNLPELNPSGSDFGKSNFNNLLPNDIPITGMIGDSHAAAFGERCFEKGTAKATMGTGSSILVNTGDYIDPANTNMVSTICWSTQHEISYALEGIIVSCGSTLNWLSEKLNLFKTGKEASFIAESLEDNGNVYLIPGFSGLGAPWWKMDLKGQIHGLTFDSDSGHIVRAGLESIVYQVTDIINAMERDTGSKLKTLQIDGGVSNSSFVTQQLADLNNTCIFRCKIKEASARGAALLAGLHFGLYSSIKELQKLKYKEEKIIKKENITIKNSYKKWLTIIENL